MKGYKSSLDEGEISRHLGCKWIEIPHSVHSIEFKRHIETFLTLIEQHLLQEEIATESDWRRVLDKLPLVSCKRSNEDASIAKVHFLCLEFPSLETDHFIRQLFDRFVLSKGKCFVVSSSSFSFEQKIKDVPRLYVGDYLIHLNEMQSFDEFKEKVISLKEQLQLAVLNKNFSFYLATTHLNSTNQKVTAIHHELIRYAHEKDEEFDASIFVDINRWLISFPSDFLDKRSPFLLAKALFALVTIRKELEWKETIDPSKRHVQLSFFPSGLNFTFGTKPILGCAMGLNLNPLCERFTDKHLNTALKAVLPSSDLTISPHHYLNESNARILYVEFEKQDGMRFYDEELERLSQQLPQEIEARVQRFVPELFMVRNEEETMKNILILTQEIQNAQDFPQLMVRYERHDEESLIFCVILVRILKPDSPSIDEAFEALEHPFLLVPERTQIVSYLEDQSPIEANVFLLQLTDLKPFMRPNFSFNFFDARAYIITLIEEAIGEIRDFNGGMILKQGENLERFKKSFSTLHGERPELLEKFFYSLNPIEMQATIEPETLKVLFITFSRLVESEEEAFFSYHFSKMGSQLFLFTKSNDHSFKSRFEEKLEEMELRSQLSISSSFYHQGFRFEGMILEEGQDSLEKLQSRLEEILSHYLQNQIKPRVLTLNLESNISLDPRIGGDHMSSIVVKNLFEGLMRLDEACIPRCACAKNVAISADQTRYTFTLKDCNWSNGMTLLAEDFEYAWKKVLSPGFKTRFAYLFFPIKNAREAKEGHCSINEVGVKALDEKTLQVELDVPAPYFLESTALALYSPVNSYIDRIHPNWAQERNEKFVCNGPFKIREPRSFYAYEFERNPQYWNADAIKLDYISISKVNRYQALKLFKNKKLDWLGAPLGTVNESFFKLSDQVGHLPTTKSFWYFFNSQTLPFINHKIRKAFCLAIDRSKIIGEDSEYMLPAYSPLPLMHTELFKNHEGLNEDPELAYLFFQEGLKELGIKEKDFPQVTVIHYNSDISSRCSTLLKQQWEEVLGIRCRIEPYEFSDLFERLTNGHFVISCFCWNFWINDPIYTLNIYRNKNEKLNFFFWENEEYKNLLHAADREFVLEKRLDLLCRAEKILTNQHFILPIFHEYDRFLKQKNFNVPIVKDLGLVDYAYGSFIKE